MLGITSLPADQFNVLVANDMDRLRLQWLVEKIGEAKLRKSVAKYRARWPGCQPFVSTILKWHHLTVPVAVYAPVAVPVYWLYLLCLRARPTVKIGMTGRWPHRAFDFLPGPRYFPVRTDRPDLLDPALRQAALLELFDGDLSVAFLVGGRAEVTRRELTAKRHFAQWRSEPPQGGLIDRSAGGRKEWFDARIIDDFKALAASYDHATSVQTLRAALAALVAADEPAAPLWARELW